MALVLAIVMPLGLFAVGLLWSAAFGFFAGQDADERYADSEYVKTRSW